MERVLQFLEKPYQASDKDLAAKVICGEGEGWLGCMPLRWRSHRQPVPLQLGTPCQHALNGCTVHIQKKAEELCLRGLLWLCWLDYGPHKTQPSSPACLPQSHNTVALCLPETISTYTLNTAADCRLKRPRPARRRQQQRPVPR